MSQALEQTAENPVFQANAVTIELPRAWFDVPRNIHREPLGLPPYAHGIYDAIEQVEGVKGIFAVADDGYVRHQGLNVIALEDGANAQKIKSEIEAAVETVTRPTYGYSESAVSHYEASKARVSTAVVQASHGHFPFKNGETPYATTFLNNLRDNDNPIGDTGKLIQAFDANSENDGVEMAVIHQFVQSGVDPETEEPTGVTIIRGMIQVRGEMDEVKSRFHDATRKGLGGLGYGSLERHTVLQVESWPGQAPA